MSRHINLLLFGLIGVSRIQFIDNLLGVQQLSLIEKMKLCLAGVLLGTLCEMLLVQ